MVDFSEGFFKMKLSKMGRGNTMVFSEQLSRLRKEMKMTQEFLAEKCNVSRQAVAKWESGESLPNIYKLIELSSLFDISLDELVLGGSARDDKKEIARRIYNLYVENVEHLRTCMMQHAQWQQDCISSDEKLATELRTVIMKSRIVFSRERVDELLEMTTDFGQSREYVLVKYGENLGNHSDRNRRYCESKIPEMYDQIEEILGEYLELQ